MSLILYGGSEASRLYHGEFVVRSWFHWPDGTPGELRRISDHPGQDSHPWFSPDGRWIVYTSERGGISDEEPLVQEVVFGPQMYGEIFAHRLSDGLDVRLTHNKWEEGNPFWLRPAATR